MTKELKTGAINNKHNNTFLTQIPYPIKGLGNISSATYTRL